MVRTGKFALLCLGICQVAGASPAHAASLAELDAMSQASNSAPAGIALARRQIAAGNPVDALATVERVLLNDPESDEAALLHASLLCRLDDRKGSLIEFDRLRGHDIPAADWSEATAPCSSGRRRMRPRGQ